MEDVQNIDYDVFELQILSQLGQLQVSINHQAITFETPTVLK